MPLVDYSSESSSDERNPPATKKRKLRTELPPLPSTFRDLYATPVRTSKTDDPGLHSGRQRVIPHIEGIWPSHVYTEWNPSVDDRRFLAKLIQLSASSDHNVQGFLLSDLGVPVPLHISLSSSLGLQGDKREDFAGKLKSNIEHADVHEFEVSAVGLRWVPNSNKTRWFYVLTLSRPPKDELNRLLTASNQTARSFGMEGLYTKQRPTVSAGSATSEVAPDISDSVTADLTVDVEANTDNKETLIDPFHVSIAWSLSQPPPTKTAEPLGDETVDHQKFLSRLSIPVEAVKAKIGNTILTIPLRPKPTASR